MSLLCTNQTAALGEPPAGSAGSAERYILVDLPLPWPKKIDDHPAIRVATNGRILAINGGERSDLATVISYERPAGPFAGFRRHETTVAPADVGDVLIAINAGDLSGLEPPSTDVDADHAEHDDIIDVLVCTHGSRDRCCGNLGARLFMELDDRRRHGEWDERVRVWRTSHIGGHRFAPTAMTFPDAMSWAWLDVDTIAGIADRTLALDTAVELARGSGGIDSRAGQIADGRGFAHFGWDWLATPRTIEVDTSGVGATEVTVASTLGSGSISLEAGDPIPVPICGEEGSTKSTPQFVVTRETWSSPSN